LQEGLDEVDDQKSLVASDVRWRQRLQSYSRATSLLEDALSRGPDVRIPTNLSTCSGIT
jgi:hypothetical protein